MRLLSRVLVVPFVFLALPISVSAAPSPAMNRVVLHSPLKTMGFQMTMASATLHAVKGGIDVNFHAQHLPSPHVLHKMAYVLWATDGNMKDRVGALKLHSGSASLMAEAMMTKIQDLVVTAENSPNVARPSGKVVLSGMVG